MGGRARQAARMGSCALLLTLAGCASQQSPGDDQAVLDTLSNMEIRIRVLQSELGRLSRALTGRSVTPSADPAGAEASVEAPSREEVLDARLDDLQQRIASLPEQMAEFCPRPSEAAGVNARFDDPDVQRVMVSGDKLVVGEEERVWLDPPAAFVVAHIDAGAEYSFMHAEDVVEFERDGSKWVRFGITADEETVSVERPLKRTARTNGERRPVVELRVQLGDVRESVEFALGELTEARRPLVLGRNFLTDVALVDVARKNVQPAFQAPES